LCPTCKKPSVFLHVPPPRYTRTRLYNGGPLPPDFYEIAPLPFPRGEATLGPCYRVIMWISRPPPSFAI
jgi:hypothetical protein